MVASSSLPSALVAVVVLLMCGVIAAFAPAEVELEAAARRQGLESLAHVKHCRLETGGALTFIPKHPTDDERRHHDLMLHLERLEGAQRSLKEQLEALGRNIDGVAKRS